MRRRRHPLSGAIYEVRNDGLLDVSLGDKVASLYSAGLANSVALLDGAAWTDDAEASASATAAARLRVEDFIGDFPALFRGRCINMLARSDLERCQVLSIVATSDGGTEEVELTHHAQSRREANERKHEDCHSRGKSGIFTGKTCII